MSEHVGYIVKISTLNPHPNADRLQIATIFDQSVIVDLNTQIGDIGVFFPTDLQLSEEYCKENDLVRRKDENGNPAGGYLEPGKRNIRAMRLRGAKSEGLFMPLMSLAYTGETKFAVGDQITIVNGHEICCKYIPRHNPQRQSSRAGNRTRRHGVPISPLFAEHADTEQLVYHLDDFHVGDQIEITLKMHGTSGRTGYLPKFQGYENDSFACRAGNALRRIFNKLRGLPDPEPHHDGTPVYDWGYVTGTRRTVLNDFEEGGYYGNNSFRAPHAQFFEGKLHKGETVYYEIVGFTDDGTPIMPSVNNSKISDKEFTKMYGKETVFSYGCNPKGYVTQYGSDDNGMFELPIEVPKSDFYVYRMTMTNEDGDVVEYTPDFMRYRCEQMGVKTVPVLWKGYINESDLINMHIDEDGNPFMGTAGEYIREVAEQFYDGPDPIGKTHVREGVVIRIVNRPKFCAYKHKNFSFKVLEGLAKDLAAEPDMEEAQDIIEEEEEYG